MTEYMINIQKLIVLLYSSSEHMDTKIYNYIKKTENIGADVTSDVKFVEYLYAENYKLLMKEIK